MVTIAVPTDSATNVTIEGSGHGGSPRGQPQRPGGNVPNLTGAPMARGRLRTVPRVAGTLQRGRRGVDRRRGETQANHQEGT